MVVTRAQLDQQDEQATRLEDRVVEQAGGPLRAQVQQATRDLTAAYVRAAGNVDQPLPPERLEAYRLLVLAALARLGGDAIGEAADAITEALGEAVALGVKHAEAVTGRVRAAAEPSPELLAAVKALPARARRDLAGAKKLARAVPVERYSQVVRVVAAATRAASRVEGTAAWATTRAMDDGVQAVCDAADVGSLWIAERGACLACLALSGVVVGPGEEFPANATFGDKPLPVWPPGAVLLGPPRHPHCRCRRRPYLGAAGGFGVDFPTTLKREAQRSVARGWAGYSSRPARARAADRLLRVGTGLPMSVRDRAAARAAAAASK